MALTHCPECKREVSDKAAACPHCGYPMTGGETNIKPVESKELTYSYQVKAFGEKSLAKGLGEQDLDVATPDKTVERKLCQKCSQRPGEEYVYYYGKNLIPESRPGKRVIRAVYEIKTEGISTITICNICIINHRLRLLAIIVALIAVMALFCWLLYSDLRPGALLNPDDSSFRYQVKLFGAGGLSILVLAPAFVFICLTSKKRLGESLAAEVANKLNIHPGADAFLGEEQYKKLKPFPD